MGKERLMALLNENKENTSEKIDWEKIKLEWLNEVESFFKIITGFLDQFGEDKIQYEISPYQMTEEQFHTYTTKKMKITLFNEQIDLVPKGKFIIAANGRIDLESSMGNVRCVLVPENAKKPHVSISIRTTVNGEVLEETRNEIEEEQSLVWKFVVERPEIRYEEINIDSFSEVILELVGKK